MLLSSLIGIQTVCVGVTAYLTYRMNNKSTKMKLVQNEKGYKQYKVGGF